MSKVRWESKDVVGLVHPYMDAHTLGLSAVGSLLSDCGIASVIAGKDICCQIQGKQTRESRLAIREWVYVNGITHLGASYRLDPEIGVYWFKGLLSALRSERLMVEQNGPIKGLFFSGLPAASLEIQRLFGDRVRVFQGHESATETLDLLDVPKALRPRTIVEDEEYDAGRESMASALLKSGAHQSVEPTECQYSEFGTRRDSILRRLEHSRKRNGMPLMRAHVGPFHSNPDQGVKEFLSWCRDLAQSRHLDVLSIGTSQLTQERFGEEWGDAPNGGGVPIRTEMDYDQVYEASRPMLVRTYAGTKDIPRLAEIHERSLNIAWHALSFWWFSQIDGRGPLSVRENLVEHFETLRFIARTGKPFEANVPHHFSFRGGDDVTYVVSAVLAARATKASGVRTFVLQNMLNTPRATSGIRDLAKARAMLTLVREEQCESFRVIYQPRAGLSLFSPNMERAKVQLAAVTALMDDVEPHNTMSPDIVHVVSYSEGSHLANPNIVDESIQITKAALRAYRSGKAAGAVPPPPQAVARHTAELIDQARTTLAVIEESIKNPYTAAGFYYIFAAGFMPVPDLWECRDEFSNAVHWRSQTTSGATNYVGDDGVPISLDEKLERAKVNLSLMKMRS